jgi:hypothetical protein
MPLALRGEVRRKFATTLVCRGVQRVWQPGQKNVERWFCTIRLTVPPQRPQTSPSRP